MRLLVLGNSGDTVDGLDGSSTAMWRIAALLEELLREPVIVRHVHAVPTPSLARFAERCIAEFAPSFVLVHPSGHVFNGPTLDWRFRRLLGGRFYGSFRLLRASARRALGYHQTVCGPAPRGRALLYLRIVEALDRYGVGAPQMTVEQAAEAYVAAIRSLARHEDMAVLVRGPAPTAINTGRARARRNARALNDSLRDVCRERRIPFCDLLALEDRLSHHSLQEGTHFDVEGNAIAGEHEFSLLRPLMTP